MTEQQIRFDDGASYERMMGAWSRLAGDVFLDWLKPGSGLRWVDVGCGNGAFSELVVQRPPSFEASRIGALRELWSDAGLDAIETREIVVQGTFNDFDDFWTTTLLIPTLGPTFAVMPPKDAGLLKTRVRARLPADETKFKGRLFRR